MGDRDADLYTENYFESVSLPRGNVYASDGPVNGPKPQKVEGLEP